MIIRRIALTMVLVLFASVTIGVILGLDDAARSDLLSRLPSAVTPSAGPDSSSATADPEPQATTKAPEPRVTTSAAPSATAPTVTQKPTAAPQATKKPTAAPKASATPTTKPKVTAKPKATTKPKASAEPKGSTKTSSKGKKGKKPSPYLKGPLQKGPGGTVYLTFDDGPSPYTAKILATLSRTGSTATFFHLGVNEGAFPHADAAIRAQGSKVGNHSYNHPDLTYLSKSQLKWQLKHGPTAKCFRPPYGATDSAVRSAIAKAGMRQVLWDVDTLDWTKPGVSTLAKTGRLKSIRHGSVVLMHDGGGDRSQTVAALPRIISDLHARGYRVRALPYC